MYWLKSKYMRLISIVIVHLNKAIDVITILKHITFLSNIPFLGILISIVNQFSGVFKISF